MNSELNESVRWFVRSFVRSFFRSFVRSFVVGMLCCGWLLTAHHFISPTKLRTSHNKVTPRTKNKSTNRKAAEVWYRHSPLPRFRRVQCHGTPQNTNWRYFSQSWSDKRTRQASTPPTAHERTRTRLFVGASSSSLSAESREAQRTHTAQHSTAQHSTANDQRTNEATEAAKKEGRRKKEGGRRAWN